MKQTAKWTKRHGFTNGLWRLEERDNARKARVMKRYSVLLAYDVPFYATVIVEANSPEEAERIAIADKAPDADFEPSWDASGDTRVADPATEIV